MGPSEIGRESTADGELSHASCRLSGTDGGGVERRVNERGKRRGRRLWLQGSFSDTAVDMCWADSLPNPPPSSARLAQNLVTILVIARS